MWHFLPLLILAADPDSAVGDLRSQVTATAPQMRFIADRSSLAADLRSTTKFKAIDVLKSQIERLKISLNDKDEGDWVADRARLEMQLATARLEYAAAKLDYACKQSAPEVRREAVLISLQEVQQVDRTLDSVNIERLDDYDRRAYRGLSAMRHRVSSMQVYTLLKISGDGPIVPPAVPEKPKLDDRKADVSSRCGSFHRCRLVAHLFSRR